MQGFHFHSKVILKEDEANDGEKVDKEESKNCCKDDWAAISCHAFYHVQQGLLSEHQINQLKEKIQISENETYI